MESSLVVLCALWVLNVLELLPLLVNAGRWRGLRFPADAKNDAGLKDRLAILPDGTLYDGDGLEVVFRRARDQLAYVV